MPVPIRSDFDALQLRILARKTKNGPQARRLLALASIYDGARRAEAAKIGGVTLQIVRDWVMRFNTHGPNGLIDKKAPGQPSKLEDTHRARQDDRRGSNLGDSRRGALAAHRSVPVDFRGIPHHSVPADHEPGTAQDGLLQALGAPTPSCAGRWRDRGF